MKWLISHWDATYWRMCKCPVNTYSLTYSSPIFYPWVCGLEFRELIFIEPIQWVGYALRIMHTAWDDALSMGCTRPRATLVSKLMYASPVWFGFLNEGSRNRCQAVLNRLKCPGYLGEDFKSFDELCGRADGGLFREVVTNPLHVMHQVLPPEQDIPYHLRPRAHNMQLPATNNYLK